MEREGGAKVSLPELSENVLDSILYLYIEIYLYILYRYKPFNATKSRLKSRELASGERSTAGMVDHQRHKKRSRA